MIDTVGLRTETTLNYTGFAAQRADAAGGADTAHGAERTGGPDRSHDPVMYSKPFTFKSVFNRTKEEQIEYICEDSRIQVTPDGRQSYHAPRRCRAPPRVRPWGQIGINPMRISE